jgi:hypothetical protein
MALLPQTEAEMDSRQRDKYTQRVAIIPSPISIKSAAFA